MSGNSDEVARLRQVAYGPGATAEERAEAEVALRALDPAEDSHQRGDESGAVDPHLGGKDFGAEDDSTSHALTDEVDVQGTEQPLWRRNIRVGWLIPVAVGALLLGVGGGLGAAGQFDPADVKAAPTPAPTTTGTGGRTSVLTIPDSGGGHIDAANALFDVPARAYEGYPLTAVLDEMGVDQSQLRLAVVDNGHKLWVVKQGTIGFCLASYDVRTSESMFQCATIEKFKQSGVAMIGTEFAAWWDGKSFVISG